VGVAILGKLSLLQYIHGELFKLPRRGIILRLQWEKAKQRPQIKGMIFALQMKSHLSPKEYFFLRIKYKPDIHQYIYVRTPYFMNHLRV
jgi:hypothetical protein